MRLCAPWENEGCRTHRKPGASLACQEIKSLSPCKFVFRRHIHLRKTRPNIKEKRGPPNFWATRPSVEIFLGFPPRRKSLSNSKTLMPILSVLTRTKKPSFCPFFIGQSDKSRAPHQQDSREPPPSVKRSRHSGRVARVSISYLDNRLRLSERRCGEKLRPWEWTN